jgi:putative transposase
MADKYRGKYRNESTRLQNWDYGWNARYFITICTKDRCHFFGEINNGKMKLSHQGVIVDLLWHEIKNHAKNVDLGEFVVMPNHVHGILILHGNDVWAGNDVADEPSPSLPNDPFQPSEQSPNKTLGQQRFQNQGKNTISSIVGSYKSAVTKHCNRLKFDFAWQSRFHDHIIRDDESFKRISKYIKNNPGNWKDDEFF